MPSVSRTSTSAAAQFGQMKKCLFFLFSVIPQYWYFFEKALILNIEHIILWIYTETAYSRGGKEKTVISPSANKRFNLNALPVSAPLKSLKSEYLEDSDTSKSGGNLSNHRMLKLGIIMICRRC
jgi:hypothetical protein